MTEPTKDRVAASFDRPDSPWPWVDMAEGFWVRFVAVVMTPVVFPVYIVLTVVAVLWSACAVILDQAFSHRINFWSPLWEGTAYYEARWRKLGGSRG